MKTIAFLFLFMITFGGAQAQKIEQYCEMTAQPNSLAAK